MSQLNKQKARAIFSLLRAGVKEEPEAVLLGDVLREVMGARGLGVRGLARVLGSSPARISRIMSEGEEAGSLRASTLDELAKLTQELGWAEITERMRLKARMKRREAGKRGGWR